MAGSWGNPDVDRAAAVKGDPVSVVPRDPQVDEVVGGVSTGRKVPNQTPTYRYLFSDGTYIDVKTTQDEQGNSGPRETVGGTALKDVAPQTASTKAPETKEFPDGSLRQWNPTTKAWEPVPGGEKPAAAANKAPTIRQLPDGSQVQYNPTTGMWEPFAGPKDQTGKAPAINLPASRPGQLTDLSLVQTQANQFIASVNADTSLNPQQRQAKIQTYLDTVVRPAAEQATKEANDYAQQQLARQQAADERANARLDLQGQREDRQQTTAERSAAVSERNAATAEGELALNRQRFGYQAGQDAVDAALRLIPYSVGPTFGDEFARGLTTLSNGGGPISFSPSSITFDAPDFEALRNYHVDQALAPLRGAAGMTAAPSVGAGAPTGMPPTAAPAIPPAYGPRTTPGGPVPQPGGTGMVGSFSQ